MPTAFRLLFLFALLTGAMAARDVTVRLSTKVHKMDLEEYVAAALAGESAAFRSEQALSAMAVAARTYAVRFAGRHRSEGYDFCETTHCQDIRAGAIAERLRRAAESTEGELLWFLGAPAATFYSKDCGGVRESVSVVWPDVKASYLGRRDDPYCGRDTWSATIRKAELAGAIHLTSRLDRLRIVERSLSGRAVRLQADGRTLSASSLRFAVGRTLGWNQIRSDLYELTDSGDRLVFEGRGFGHGVGLCQAGADRMGVDGRSYREILAFYYPGTTLGVTAQGFSWRSLGGERVEVITTRPQEDQFLVALADRMAATAEQRSGLRWQTGARLKVFPTVAAFRDSTGEPGWVAASARGRVIRFQPVAVLRARGVLESTLAHELMHVLVESRASSGLPVWFREGVVGLLTASQKSKVKSQKSKVLPPGDSGFLRGREEARLAHAAALECVTDLVARFGEPAVLGWLERGLPADLFPGVPSTTPGSTRR